MPDEAYAGAQTYGDGATDYDTQVFVIRQMLARVATMQLAAVRAVRDGPRAGEPPRVDIQLMVNQVDGNDQPTAHGTIHNVPTVRWQGGSNAVILRPVVGDVGLALVSARDISTVKATGAVSNPGSRRQFSYADSIYLGGVLNGPAVQMIEFLEDRIRVTSPTMVEVVSPVIELGGIDFLQHRHLSTTPGSPTGVPLPTAPAP